MMSVYQRCPTVTIAGEHLEFFFLKATPSASPKSAYLKKKKRMNLCYKYIYILQLTVPILIDNDIMKPTIRQNCILVQSIQIYPLLS